MDTEYVTLNNLVEGLSLLPSEAQGYVEQILSEAPLSQHEVRERWNEFSENVNAVQSLAERREYLASPEVLCQVALTVVSAIRNSKAIELRPNQIYAGLSLIDENGVGRIGQMDTGEGKSLAYAITIFTELLLGNKVHVYTTTEELAERDASLYTEISKELTGNGELDKRLVFGTPRGFVFPKLNERVSDWSSCKSAFQMDEPGNEGNCTVAVLDEVDAIIVDVGQTPFIIATKENEIIEGSHELDLLNTVFNELYNENDKRTVYTPGAQIDDKFQEQVIGHLNAMIEEGDGVDDEGLDWDIISSFIPSFVTAYYGMQEGFDYQIVDQENDQWKIEILDRTTGQKLKDNAYTYQLQVALAYKHSLPIPIPTSTIIQTTFAEHLGSYDTVCGLTGSSAIDFSSWPEPFVEVGDIERLYKAALGRKDLQFIDVPRHNPDQRINHQLEVYQQAKDMYERAIDLIQQAQREQRPILIDTWSITEVDKFLQSLPPELRDVCSIVTGNDPADFDTLAVAGKPGAITISNQFAGRGVHIPTSEDVDNRGGLIVVVLGVQNNRRVVKQMLGRTGRQGAHGTTYTLASLDDNRIDTIYSADEQERLRKKFIKHLMKSASRLMNTASSDLLSPEKLLLIVAQQMSHEYKVPMSSFFNPIAFRSTMSKMYCSDTDPNDVLIALDEYAHQIAQDMPMTFLDNTRSGVDIVEEYYKRRDIDDVMWYQDQLEVNHVISTGFHNLVDLMISIEQGHKPKWGVFKKLYENWQEQIGNKYDWLSSEFQAQYLYEQIVKEYYSRADEYKKSFPLYSSINQSRGSALTSRKDLFPHMILDLQKELLNEIASGLVTRLEALQKIIRSDKALESIYNTMGENDKNKVKMLMLLLYSTAYDEGKVDKIDFQFIMLSAISYYDVPATGVLAETGRDLREKNKDYFRKNSFDEWLKSLELIFGKKIVNLKSV